ncbi:MAG: phytoene desaturase family protein [Chitinophagaceae bacterium]
MPDRKKKIAVIGSGFGGLSAAIRLAAKGHDVTIYEKLDKPGGRAYQYEMNGFRFDAGPTVITAPHQYDELFELAGKKREDYMTLVPLDPFYRIFDGNGAHFDYWRSQEQTEAEIRKYSPGDLPGYRKFIKGVHDIFNWFHPFTEKSFSSLWSFLRIFPHVIKTGTWRSMYAYAAKYIKNQFIRKVASFHPLLVGGNPFDTPSIYGLIIQFEKKWGVHYCIGGTGAIVNALCRLFEDCGGKIRVSAEVKEIVIHNKKAAGIELTDGTVYEADEVVCNGDIAFAYKNYIPSSVRPKPVDLWLSNLQYSNSLVVIYFGTRKKYDTCKLSHHNLILGNEYSTLMRDIFKRKVLPRELGLYLHMPSRTDDTIAPPGCDSFYVLSLVPNLDGKIPWHDVKDEYVDRIMDFLETNYLPDLKANLAVRHVVTPLHFQSTLNSHKGAAFSIKPSMMQSGFFRPQVKSKWFNNLYFVGAGVHPGAGVPAVMASGKIAATAIES